MCLCMNNPPEQTHLIPPTQPKNPEMGELNPLECPRGGRFHSRLVLVTFPEHPSNDSDSFQRHRCPQCTSEPDRCVRPQPAKACTKKQQYRRRDPPIPLDIVQGEQLGVREQVTVVTRKHDARQPGILQRPGGDSLSTRLEGDDANGDKYLPMQAIRRLVPKRDNERCDDNEEQLERVRRNEHPALPGREVAVEARKDKGAEAERPYRGARLDPANPLRGRDETQAKIHGVSWRCVSMIDGNGATPDSPVCMLTKEPQMKTAELSSRPVMM